jgi:tight adherence protein C
MDFSILTILASICAGIAATCLALATFSIMEMINIETMQYDEDGNPIERNFTKRLPIIFKMLLPFASNMNPIVKNPVFDNMRYNSNKMILMAGYDQTITCNQFIAVRLLLVILSILVLIGGSLVGKPLIAIMLAMCLAIYPPVWLKAVIKKRHLEIMKSLPNVLDLLTLSVEAGKDFLTALRDILGRRKMDALGEELSRALQEIQLGKQRQEALRDLSQRVQQPDFSSVINAVIQAEELGVSIGQLLKVQGDQLRSKRFSRAEKLANEAPVKILFPVIVFIFPPVIVILMGPIVMQAFKTLVK